MVAKASTSEQAPASPRAKINVTITDMPPEIIHRVLSYLFGSSIPGCLDDQSFAGAMHAYSLCCNNSYLYSILRESFHCAYLTQNTLVKAVALARLFGKSLRNVAFFLAKCSIFDKCDCPSAPASVKPLSPWCYNYETNFSPLRDPINDAAKFLEALSLQNPQLESISLRISGIRETFPEDALVGIIKCSKNSLESIRIAVPDFKFDSFAPKIVPYLSNIKALWFRKTYHLEREHVFSFLEATGPRLEKLSLSSMCLSGLDSSDFHRICEICPRLSCLEVLELPLLSIRLGSKFSKSFWEQMLNVRVKEISIRSFLSNFGMLDSLKDKMKHTRFEISWKNDESAEQTISTLDSIGHWIHSVCFRAYVFKPRFQEYVSRIKVLLPAVRELHLENLESKENGTLVKMFAPFLRKLYVRGNFLSYEHLFEEVEKCKSLEVLSLRFRDHPSYATLTEAMEHRLRLVSSVKQMFRTVGELLRRFTWNNPVVLAMPNVPCRFFLFEELPCDFIADSLRTHCHRVEYVHIFGLEPAFGCNKSYRRAFNVLERHRPGLTLYLSELTPRWYQAGS